jgi:RimJ/RimL family protein N-acetyltransferase
MIEVDPFMTVVLSPCIPADLERLLAMLEIDAVREGIFGATPRPPGLGELRRRWMQALDPGEARWDVGERADGPARGCLMVEDDMLSYFTDPMHWGQGLATRAVCALVSARAGAVERPLEAWVDRRNAASCRVLERAGFMFAGLRYLGPTSTASLCYREGHHSTRNCP